MSHRTVQQMSEDTYAEKTAKQVPAQQRLFVEMA
jgi:hypothetical protein